MLKPAVLPFRKQFWRGFSLRFMTESQTTPAHALPRAMRSTQFCMQSSIEDAFRSATSRLTPKFALQKMSKSYRRPVVSAVTVAVVEFMAGQSSGRRVVG